MVVSLAFFTNSNGKTLNGALPMFKTSSDRETWLVKFTNSNKQLKS